MAQSLRVVVVPVLAGLLGAGSAIAATPGGAPVPAAATPPAAPVAGEPDAATPAGAAAAASALGLPSLIGPIGLFETSTAEVGPAHQLRVGLHAEYFSASDFLIAGDADQRLRGELAVGFTPHRRLELFGALLTSSNRNDRTRAAGDGDPPLLKSFGDLVLGAKGIYPLAPGATVGFELGLKFLAGVSNLSFSPSSTSLWLGPIFTYDLRQTALVLPLRVHVGVNFYLDNSSNLRDLSAATTNTKEAALFGYGIAPSRLRMAVAADVPLGRDVLPVPLDPFLEYHFEYATGDADGAFAAFAPPACGRGGSSQPCVDNRDSHWVTLGVRAVVFRGLTADLGIDLRVRSPGYPYGAPLPPYNVLFGLSLPVDLDAIVHPAVVVRTVEVPVQPRQGYVSGQVRSADGAPIAGAIIAIARHPHASAATDAEGGFTTVELDPGPVDLQVSAPGFESALVQVGVTGGRAAPLTVTLAARPPSATVHGRALGRDGKGVPATVKVAGQGKTGGIFEGHADAAGAYTMTLPAGTYRARGEAPGLPPQEMPLELAANQDKTLDFVWRAATAPSVSLADGNIRIAQPIRFVGGSAKLAPESQRTLDAVADLLNAHGELGQVAITAHWDGSLADEPAQALTQQQAEAVRGYLLARGIQGDRLTAAGAGNTRPLVTGDSPASKLKNRRVELHVK